MEDFCPKCFQNSGKMHQLSKVKPQHWRRYGTILEDILTDPRYWTEYELTIDIAVEVSHVSDPISGSYFIIIYYLNYIIYYNMYIYYIYIFFLFICFAYFIWSPSNQPTGVGNIPNQWLKFIPKLPISSPLKTSPCGSGNSGAFPREFSRRLCLCDRLLNFELFDFAGGERNKDPNNKHMGVSKNRGKTPKMDGLFHGKPY